MDREAWCAAVRGVTKSWTRLSYWTYWKNRRKLLFKRRYFLFLISTCKYCLWISIIKKLMIRKKKWFLFKSTTSIPSKSWHNSYLLNTRYCTKNFTYIYSYIPHLDNCSSLWQWYGNFPHFIGNKDEKKGDTQLHTEWKWHGQFWKKWWLKVQTPIQ